MNSQLFVFIVFMLHYCLSASIPEEYEEVEIVENDSEPEQRSISGRILTGNDCEYIKLGSITANDGCTNGNKFVIKQVSGVRKQFLILNGEAILGFVTKGKKFTACTSYTEVTANVDCKVVNGLSDVDLSSSNSSSASNTSSSSESTTSLGDSSSSNAAYCTLNDQHTMCKYEGPSSSCSSKTIFRQLSSTAKTAILDRHNELRRKVAKGEEVGGINAPQPAAANMKKMVWNTELEDIAQRWADQCTFGHDSVRSKLDGTSVGQNAYIGYSSAQSQEDVIQAAMAGPAQSWYGEVTSPGFDSQSINPFKFSSGAGHYTQLVWADSEELGCAVVYFKDTSAPLDYNNLVVCNYATAGNYLNAVMYETGTTCSACPTGYSCEDGLCAK